VRKCARSSGNASTGLIHVSTMFSDINCASPIRSDVNLSCLNVTHIPRQEGKIRSNTVTGLSTYIAADHSYVRYRISISNYPSSRLLWVCSNNNR